MDKSVVRFNREVDSDFVSQLRTRVNDYFVEKGISKFGNFNMVFKTFFILALYFIPFSILIFGGLSSVWGMLLMWGIMGLGMAGIGLSIIHDANHGSYSKHKIVNRAMGYLLNIVGTYHVTWKIQHNVLHHSSTNVHEYDDDLKINIMRFSPKQRHRRIFKFQAFYAPFFYGLLSLNKFLSKDFEQVFRYHKRKLLSSQGLTLSKAITQSVINKVVYVALTIALPMYVLDFAWWQVILGFFTMQFICGLILSLIFQSAHVLEKTKFYTADQKGNLENCWAVHQLNTTANFGANEKLFSWLIGGLNFQIEHHLFPNICHVHYREISKIVRSTAKEYGITYNEYPSFFSAVFSHFRMLNQLGRAV